MSKPLILYFNSQFGNQMFQYALYRKLEIMGKDIKADLTYYDNHPNYWRLDVFQISPRIATRKEILKSTDHYRSFYCRMKRKLLGRKPMVFEDKNRFDPDIFNIKHGHIEGFWQSEKYFEDISDDIRKKFTFPPFIDKRNIELAKDIKKCNSVSIHIRRGDYKDVGFFMLDEEYYANCMRYFDETFGKCFYYVFANDTAWAKEHIHAENIVFVDWNTGKEAYNDMHLMSLCKHNIIANSSFSWWGAWLNQNKDKIVLAPKPWFRHLDMPDIYAKGWKIIENA